MLKKRCSLLFRSDYYDDTCTPKSRICVLIIGNGVFERHGFSTCFLASACRAGNISASGVDNLGRTFDVQALRRLAATCEIVRVELNAMPDESEWWKWSFSSAPLVCPSTSSAFGRAAGYSTGGKRLARPGLSVVPP